MSYGLALTLAIEVPIHTLLLMQQVGLRPMRAAAAGIGVNLVSHPLLFGVVAPRLGPLGLPRLTTLEAAAVLIEWLLLLAWLRRRATELLVSCIANAASLAAGLGMAALWP